MLTQPFITKASSSTETQLPATVWCNPFGSGGAEAAIQTSDGGYALVCPLEGGYWLAKLGSDGDVQWHKVFTSTYGAFPKSLVQTSDGGYAIVGTTGYESPRNITVWLVKTDENGNMQWNKSFGDSQGVYEANSLVQTSDGGYAIAGDFAGFTGYTGLGGWNFLFIKTDSEGNLLWTKLYGSPDDDRAEAIVQTTDGGYALAGCTSIPGNTPRYWLVKTDSAGIMQWNQSYSESLWNWAYGMVQTSDGGYVLVGTESENLGGGDAIWLVKTDALGNMQWNRNIGNHTSWATSVIQTSDGGYAIADDNPSFQLVKTDSEGQVQWMYNSTIQAFATVVVQAKDGSYVLFGSGYLAKIAADNPSPQNEPIKPAITLNCQSSALSDIRVTIEGNLTADGIGLAGVPILFSYSVNNGASWIDLTLVNTSGDGSFVVLWTPSVTGNYLINATWAGNSQYPQTSTVVNFAITPYDQQNAFSVTSNSTLTAFSFDSQAQTLDFQVSGATNTTGYVDLYIPKSLINDTSNLRIRLDGTPIIYTVHSAGDAWLVSFTYHHSNHKVSVDLSGVPAVQPDLSMQFLVFISVVAIIGAITAVGFFIQKRKKQAENRICN